MSLLRPTSPHGRTAVPRVPPLRAAPRTYFPSHPARHRRRRRPARTRRAPRVDLLTLTGKPNSKLTLTGSPTRKKVKTDDADETAPLPACADAARVGHPRARRRADERARRGADERATRDQRRGDGR